MYLSLAVSLHIHEGMFYWYTDAKGGPSFSQVHVSYYVHYLLKHESMMHVHAWALDLPIFQNFYRFSH